MATSSTTTSGSGQKVDLVVIIDGSGGFDNEAAFLDPKIENMITAAQQKCPAQINVKYFSIQKVHPNPQLFQQTLLSYLLANKADPAKVKERQGPISETDGSKSNDGQASDLGYAVYDASYFYPWEQDAKRVILLIGDEGWYAGDYSDTSNGQEAVATAIDAAKKNNVTVYTWRTRGTQEPNTNEDITAEYKSVADQTNGKFFDSSKGDPADLEVGFIGQLVCDQYTGGSDPDVGGDPGTVDQPAGTGDTGTLCDQLPAIIKTICSLTTLLNKVVDACYPPSSWPTSSYPDGCGDVGGGSGKKNGSGGCGCGGGSKSGNKGPVVSNPPASNPDSSIAIPNASRGAAVPNAGTAVPSAGTAVPNAGGAKGAGFGM